MSPARRRLGVVGGIALVLAAVAIGPALPAAAAPVTTAAPATLSVPLQEALARTAGSGMTDVLVTLRGRPDLSGLAGTGHPQRLREVLRRLQAGTMASQAPLRARLRVLAAHGEVADVTPLWVTNAVSLTATAAAIAELAARPDVESVILDTVTVRTVAGSAEPNIATVGAPQLWDAGQTGQGVVVATLDTGVDTANPDLAARWRGGPDSWFDPYGQHPDAPVDLDGHGTATMGAIVGADGAGTSYGMAPGATWIAARIFDDRGGASTTAIHEAFQWVLDPDHDPATADAPQVVNGSWVLGTGPSCDLTFQADVQALRAAGIVPVFAAGNFGPYAASSASPANYPESLSVGAVTSSDAVWAYTSAGPSTCGGRSRVFPDLVAPGVSVLSADRYDGYTYLSGTSIAAPHVAGALALLLGAQPGAAGSAGRLLCWRRQWTSGPPGRTTGTGRGGSTSPLPPGGWRRLRTCRSRPRPRTPPCRRAARSRSRWWPHPRGASTPRRPSPSTGSTPASQPGRSPRRSWVPAAGRRPCPSQPRRTCHRGPTRSRSPPQEEGSTGRHHSA